MGPNELCSLLGVIVCKYMLFLASLLLLAHTFAVLLTALLYEFPHVLTGKFMFFRYDGNDLIYLIFIEEIW